MQQATDQIQAAAPATSSQPAPRRSIPKEWKTKYESSRIDYRLATLRSGLTTHQWVLWLIISINAIVFASWQYAIHTWTTCKDSKALETMYNNFICCFPNLSAGRYWSLLTSCFSHQDINHFALNNLSLYLMAPSIITLLGPAGFALLYIGSGLGGCIFSLSWRRYVTPWINRESWTAEQQALWQENGAHGASGSIFGVISTFALINPSQIFKLFFVVSFPAWVCVPGLFAWDLYSAWGRPESGTDSAAHLGGSLCGLLFWRFKLRSFRI